MGTRKTIMLAIKLMTDLDWQRIQESNVFLLNTGHIILLHYHDGLQYFDMEPPTDGELANLDRIVMTSEADWEPSILDNKINLEDETDPINLEKTEHLEFNFAVNGDDSVFGDLDFSGGISVTFQTRIDNYSVSNTNVKKEKIDIEKEKPGWVLDDAIKKMFEKTTQFY